jgi:hypothetical protein
MSARPNPDRLIEAYLEEGQTILPDRVYDTVRDQVERTRQRVVVVPWRTPDMTKIIGFGLAAVAVLVVAAFIGFNLLGGTNTGGQPAATSSPSPSATAVPTAEPTASGALFGSVSPGPYETTEGDVAFSFAIEQTGWSVNPTFGFLEKRAADGYRWIAWFQPFDSVATDGCAAEAATVGPTVDDFATAMLSIPGTDAEAADTTVGGLPAKVVTLTLHDDIGCGPRSFYLYGPNSAFPDTLDSVVRAWIVEVDGTRYVIQTTQDAPDDAIAAETQQIIDSIEFR